MQKKSFFKPYIHYFIYFICAFSYSYALDISFPDDGLRHISFSSNIDIMKSWGNVYPYSLFGDYDPWYGWHFLLSTLLKVISYETIHIYINTFSLFFLMILSDANIRKYVKYDFSSLLYIIVFILTMLTSYRYVMLRPDMLSGLYIMGGLLLMNRFKSIFILTLLYIPFYYLFFIYTGSLGLVYLVQKKLKLFFGVLTASIIGLFFHIIYDYEGYTTTVFNILNDQNLRMGLAVKEGVPIFSFLEGFSYIILLPFFFITSAIIIWKNYTFFSKNSLALFLLITSILWINQYRYYHLFFPIICIYIFVIVINLDKKVLFYNSRKILLILKRYFNFSKNKKLFYIVTIPYSIIMLSYIFSSQSLTKEIEKGRFFKEEIYTNKTILSNKMDKDMFIAHYFNPTIKLIPSCSIGWFENKDKEMKDIYVRLMSLEKTVSEKDLKKIIDYTHSDFYIHYLNSKQKFNFEKLTSLGIIAKEIDSKKILFEIKK